MSNPDDFEIIDEREPASRNSNQMLPWLAGILVLVLFGCAVGIAFMRISDRLQDPSPNPAIVDNGTETPAETQGALPVAILATATSSTPEPGVSPTASATPTSTPTSTPDCVVPVDEAFRDLNPEAVVGCALTPATVVWAAYEPFERGAMLWRSDTDAAYAFLAGGRWQRINERWDGQTPQSRGGPPPGTVAPERGFGYVWSIRNDLFSALGWALEPEKGFCARIQEFSRGWILTGDPVPSCTAENLYNQATSGNWRPLLLVADNTNRWLDATSGTIATPISPGNRSRPPEHGIVAVPLPSNAITLDGILSDWPGDWQPIPHVVQDANAFAGGPDLSARFQALHTTEGLLLAVRVQDDIYRPAPIGSNQWQGDGIELQFDRELSSDYAKQTADEDDTQIGIAFDETVTTLRGYRWLPFSREGALDVPGTVAAIGPLTDYGGYNAEFLIPWPWLGVSATQVTPDSTFGFNISINDNDGLPPAQQTVLSFSPRRTTHDNPTEWATLVLKP